MFIFLLVDMIFLIHFSTGFVHLDRWMKMDLNEFESEMCFVFLRNLEVILNEFESKISESL